MIRWNVQVRKCLLIIQIDVFILLPSLSEENDERYSALPFPFPSLPSPWLTLIVKWNSKFQNDLIWTFWWTFLVFSKLSSISRLSRTYGRRILFSHLPFHSVRSIYYHFLQPAMSWSDNRTSSTVPVCAALFSLPLIFYLSAQSCHPSATLQSVKYSFYTEFGDIRPVCIRLSIDWLNDWLSDRQTDWSLLQKIL